MKSFIFIMVKMLQTSDVQIKIEIQFDGRKGERTNNCGGHCKENSNLSKYKTTSIIHFVICYYCFIFKIQHTTIPYKNKPIEMANLTNHGPFSSPCPNLFKFLNNTRPIFCICIFVCVQYNTEQCGNAAVRTQ